MPRDRLIVQHVGRFRITTNEVVHKLFFPHSQPNAVTKVTARLTAAGLLRQFPLYHPRAYFTLGEEGQAFLGLSGNRVLPLGPQSLPIEYGVLAYSTLGRVAHNRLSRRELQQQYPFLTEGLIEQPYTECENVLELIRVDLGGSADHVARKCVRDIELRGACIEFSSLMLEGRFRLVVVTCTTEKAAVIRTALDQHLWPEGLQIHLAVVPDLILLTASLQNAS